jgi:energy-coupling factor transporter ATP-binding protein EcfA2
VGSPVPKGTRALVVDELLGWCGAQPQWLQDLARRLCASQTLDDAEVAEVGAMLLAEAGALPEGEVAPEPTPLSREHLPQDATEQASPKLHALCHVKGLGAVKGDKPLCFDNPLTVIYGANGAGKSSYAKIIKNACRARHRAERILPNVFSTAPPAVEAQTARFKVHVGTEKLKVERGHEDEPEPLLSTISVFDDHCAEAYVSNKPGALSYVPQSVHLVARLAEHVARVKDWCQQQASLNELALPELGCAEGTGIWRAIERGADEAELAQLALRGDDEHERGRALREALEGTAPKRVAERAARMRRLESLQGRWRRARVELESLAHELPEAREHLARAEQDAQAITRAAEHLALLPGSGSPAWREMWSAAQDFHLECAGNEVALPDAHRCPLCQTVVSDDARSRLAYLAGIAKGDAMRAVDQAKTGLGQLLQRLAAARLDPHELNDLQGSEIEATVTEDLREHNAACNGLASVARIAPPSTVNRLTDAFDGWISAEKQRMQTLQQAMDETERRSLEEELAELDAREWLSKHIKVALRHQAVRSRASRLERAISSASTNKLTTLQKKLTKLAVTDALHQRFEEERRALRLEHLPIDLGLRATRGEAQATVELRTQWKGATASSILSGGEKRALALAFFLAEVRAAEHGGGVVLDDPVTSLDYERLDHVAERLVEMSERRQVIVFTHDLRFQQRLVQFARERNIQCNTVRVYRHGEWTGVVTSEMPWSAQPTNARIARLRTELERLAQAETADDAGGERYQWECRGFLTHLRCAWEGAIEEKLFRGAVSRLDPEIHARQLAKVRVTEELVHMAHEGMTRSSLAMHHQPSMTRDQLPTAAEARALVDVLEQFAAKCDEAAEGSARRHTAVSEPVRGRV